MGDDRSKISASPGLPPVSGDAIMFGCIDSLGREAVLLVISRIVAKQNREIIVSAKNSLKEGSEILASAEICDFKTEPIEFFMESPGKVAIKFLPPESITIKSVNIKRI